MNFDNIDLIKNLIKKKNWNLEGDGLFLNLMFDISKQLEKCTVECLQNLTSMSNNLEKTNIALENTNNKIYCLQNTQFIENRVFDDDETTIIKAEVASKSNDENSINTILNNNLRVMNKYHEKVAIDFNESDEEDVDDRNKNIIYRSKSLYEMRPLPHVFWTKNWKEKSHVGIYESDEDFSDSENEEYSDSDDNTSLPSKTATISESSSSLLALNSSNCAQNKLSSSEDNLGSTYYVHKPKSNNQIDHTSNKDIKDIQKSNDSAKIHSQTNSNIFNDEPPELDESLHPSDHLNSSTNMFFATSDDEYETIKKPTISYSDHKQVENENKFTRKPINLFEDNDDNDDFDKLINGLKAQTIEKKSSIIKHSKNLFDSDSEEDISSQMSIPENCDKLSNYVNDTIKTDRSLSPNILSNHNPMLPKIDSIINKSAEVNNKWENVDNHTSSSFKEDLIDDIGRNTTEKKLNCEDHAKKFPVDLFGDEEEDEFDILFNRSLNKKNTLKSNPVKEPLFDLDSDIEPILNSSSKEKYNSSLQGKLFDSESDDELIAKVATTNTKVNLNTKENLLNEASTSRNFLNKSKKSIKKTSDKNTSNIKSMLSKDILLDSDLEDDATVHTKSESLFDFIKSDKLKEASIFRKADDFYSGENNVTHMIEPENIADSKATNYEQSYTRDEKLFNSESEDEDRAVLIKSNTNLVMDDSQASMNNVKSIESEVTISEVTINQNDDQNLTEKNKVFDLDKLENDLFSLDKNESSLENNVILASSQSLSAGYVSIGLFEDIPPEDDNDDTLLFTNQTKRTQNVFYDDFADTFPAGASNIESIPYSYNIFDDEPPPDTSVENLVKSEGLKSDLCSALINHNQMERNDITENFEKSFPRSSTIEANENETDHDIFSELPTTPKKLSKTKLNINVKSLIEGAKLQIEKKQQSFLEPTNDIILSNDEKSSAATLAHLNKHRAKLPMNRKPSTRRGRHENYKKTMACQTENEIENYKGDEPATSSSNSNVNNNPQSTNEDNIHDKPKYISKKSNILNNTKATTTLFSSDDEDGGLFGKHSLSATKKKEIKRPKKTMETQQRNIFDDISDDDDSLFTVADKKLNPKKIIQSASKKSLLSVDICKSTPDNPLGLGK